MFEWIGVCGRLSLVTASCSSNIHTCTVKKGATALNYAVVSKYGKVLIWKINASIWFWHKQKEELKVQKIKEKYKAQRVHTCQNPKMAQLTSEFVVAMENGGHALLCFGSIRSVRQWDEILSFSNFFKIIFPATSKQFHIFKGIFCVSWTNTIL